jgi:hypothetical protein
MVNECEIMPVIAAVSKAGRAKGIQEKIGLKMLDVRLRMTGAENWNETCLLLPTVSRSSSRARLLCRCEVLSGGGWSTARNGKCGGAGGDHYMNRNAVVFFIYIW